MELYRSHVLVCGGTGCSSSGSATLIERFGEQLKEKGAYSDGKRERVPRIGAEHMVNGQPVEEYTIGAAKD